MLSKNDYVSLTLQNIHVFILDITASKLYVNPIFNIYNQLLVLVKKCL